MSTTTSSHTDLQTEIGQLIERRESLATEIADIDEAVNDIRNILTNACSTKPNKPQRASAGQPVGRIGAPVKPKGEPSGHDGHELTHVDAALVFVEKNGPVALKEVIEFLSDRHDSNPYSTIGRLVGKGELQKYSDKYGVKHVALA